MRNRFVLIILLMIIILFTGCRESIKERYKGKSIEIYSIDDDGNLIRENSDFKWKGRVFFVYEFDNEHIQIGKAFFNTYGELYEENKYNKNGKTIRRIVYHSNGKVKDEEIYNDKEELIKVNSYNRKGEKLY